MSIRIHIYTTHAYIYVYINIAMLRAAPKLQRGEYRFVTLIPASSVSKARGSVIRREFKRTRPEYPVGTRNFRQPVWPPMSHDDQKLSAILGHSSRFPLHLQLNFSHRMLLLRISKGDGRFIGNEEPKKGTRILEFLRRRELVIISIVVFVVEATHSPPQLSLKPLACLRRLPGGKRGTMELFVQLFFPRFETFQRHFNERTRSILVAAQPSPPPSVRTEPRHFFPGSLPSPVGVTSPASYAYAIPTGLPLNAESALFQLRERQ